MNQDSKLALVEKNIRDLNIPRISERKVNLDTLLKEDLAMDSLNILILLVKIQEHYNINISDMKEGLSQIERVRDLVDLVQS
ncbi:acyl carrier protein [Xenorhabdus bovienii]|uniref:acyl carrier protein n=1 Tax=Xenorhabdus bovienii TaxID=40576 RepID=UPI0023B3587D|nr:acyl carrier protein [Xenorhabdus bovienii]MDE9482405.1 acyl carrier protein [Xenorhabdus bovienii]MDE9556281.1 acyl carrier protein [Xenorhabdus bovienii]